MTSAQQPERRLILLAAGALGASCVMTQLALMREFLEAFSGNEMVLGIVLGLWLLQMGAGAWLGRASDRLRNPLAVLAIIQMALAVLPLLQVFFLRALRNVVFVRGADVGVTETLFAAFVLLLPYCVAAGYALTLACALLAGISRAAGPNETESPRRAAGRVYLADGIGSIGGGLLFSFVFVRFLDHLGILLYPALLNLLVASALAFRAGRTLVAMVAAGAAPVALAVSILIDLDGVSTRLQYPRQHIVARASSPYGRLVVTESASQFNFIENGVPLTSTRDEAHVEEAVHYAMAQRPEARKVLLVAGGISGTAREILKYNVQRVDYVELDPRLLELAREHLPANLADSRIQVITADGRQYVRQSRGQYDVVIVDTPDPSTAQLNRFYTVEFFNEVKRILAPGGVMSFALGHYENYVSPELAHMLASAGASLKQTYHHVQLIPGGRVFFLASDGPLFDNIAARIEEAGVETKLVNRHYLDAMLTADRKADLDRAIAGRAALNEDFNPVLYYYHLRHWMSQFKPGLGPLSVLLFLVPAICLVRFRGPALVLFASGFAGTTLEIVLLLAFQVFCGSVYHQVGIIVTMFMAGLALGAFVMNRERRWRCAGGGELDGCRHDRIGTPSFERPGTPLPAGGLDAGAPVVTRLLARDSRTLPGLALAIAGYAMLLAILLPLLNRAAGSAQSLMVVKVTVALLTLVLALLVGMQFPPANRLEFDGTPRGVSRLYTADFMGAFLGALLASTWLIPVIGVVGVCLLTAALNLVAGFFFRLRKAVT